MLTAVTGGQGQIYSTRKYRKESKHCFFSYVSFVHLSLLKLLMTQDVLVSAA